MKKFELGVLKALKTTVDMNLSTDKQVNSKCLALLYQPKRIVVEKNSKDKNRRAYIMRYLYPSRYKIELW